MTRTLKPLDEETLYTSVRKTHRVVLVQEACRTAGIAAEWGMLIQENCFDWLDAPILRLAGEDVPIPYAGSLERVIWPTPERIVQAARQVCYYPGEDQIGPNLAGCGLMTQATVRAIIQRTRRPMLHYGL